MESYEREIEYYETEDGKRPFYEWLNSLKDHEGRRIIKARIRRVMLGNLGYCASVGKGVVELKIDFGPGYRVYFGKDGNKIIILLNGGNKDSQRRDINTAHEYWENYRRRYYGH